MNRSFNNAWAAALVLATASVAGAAPAQDRAAIQSLIDATGGRAQVSTSRATGVARFVTLKADATGSLAATGLRPEQALQSFLNANGRAFGISNVATELVLEGSRKTNTGSLVTYLQVHQGVPVFAGVIRGHFDAKGNLMTVNGTFVPEIRISPAPSKSASDADAAAIAAVGSKGLQAKRTTLYVFREGLAKGVEGLARLAYFVEVTNGRDVREFVFVDAHTGKVIERVNMIQDALSRKVYQSSYDPGSLVWQEGDALPYTGPDAFSINQIIDFSEDSYQLYARIYGNWDSYDNLGHVMETVNNDPTITCPNANWNGVTTNYCTGTTSDDVVAHEWGHAYTEYSHGLIYQWQPGALNESYSDIFGETTDLLNGAGTDTPGSRRKSDGTACTAFSDFPAQLRVNSPATIDGDYAAGSASFGPALTGTGLTGVLAMAVDTTAPTGNGCEAIGPEVNGKIALIDRGTCAFTIKVKNAQNAGAIGVVIADTVEQVVGMSGVDATIVIPSIRVALSTGNLLKTELASNPNVTLRAAVPAYTDNTYKWLIGEDATGFGGAIRDMWNPTCHGNPGKVSDTQYHCSTSDAGGVHGNSGVPNHAFALLTDGGTYNGQTIARLNLVRTAAIYRKAQLEYQVPTTDFADHADALDASCRALIGVNLPDPATGLPSGQFITSGNCDNVNRAMTAVEMRMEPTQCNFQPMLAKNPPPLCAAGDLATSFLSENFTTGAPGWTVAHTAVYGPAGDADWTYTNISSGNLWEIPPGMWAYAEDLDGACSGLPDDASAAQYLMTPVLTAPAGGKLSFQHYLASEASYDGGNVQISVAGGPWSVVPSSSYIYNAYNMTMAAAPGNTSPLAGQQGFSGGDGGSVISSAGRSQIDLSALVTAGQTFQLRYAFGNDGCGAVLGWLVRDVNAYTCQTAQTGAAEMTTPAPGTQLAAGINTFRWTAGAPAGFPRYNIKIGSALGGNDYADQNRDRQLYSYNFGAIAQDGRTIYVRLTTFTAAGAVSYDYSYRMPTP